MAPYRVQLFSEIGKQCELYVCFEQMRSSERNERWYDESSANFHLVELIKWDKPIKTIKLNIIKHIRSICPDVVIAYEYHTNTSLLMLSYCYLKGIPCIINCDGAFLSKSVKDIVKKFYISRANGYISSGMMAERYFLHYGANKRQIFYNHFTSLHKKDILDKTPSVEDKDIARQLKGIKEKQVVLSVGQFIHRKGYDVLLKAVSHLDGCVGIYIIGGKVTPEYERIVRELNLKNVHFVDFTSPDELKQYFISADVFVLPTREDVWGLVINEAMSHALPVVTTDRCIAGIEMIEDGINGYLVPTENSVMLGDVLNTILSDELMRDSMANENLKRINLYTYETSAQDIMFAINTVYESKHKDN